MGALPRLRLPTRPHHPPPIESIRYTVILYIILYLLHNLCNYHPALVQYWVQIFKLLYVTVFWKTDHMDTNTEIHFLPVDKSHTHAVFRNTKHLRLDGRVCFYRRFFYDAVKPRGCHSWPLWPLRGINKTAWAAKLILMANLYPLSLNVYFTPPTAPHPPPPLTPPPSHPPTPYRLNPCYYRS